jgi:hypothetical protein
MAKSYKQLKTKEKLSKAIIEKRKRKFRQENRFVADHYLDDLEADELMDELDDIEYINI